jgi:serine/threonine-protein kinase
MGTVHLALANGFGHFRKLIVVKELRQDLIRQKGFIRLFMDEAKLAARLSHPNVVETFEAIHEGNRYFLTMEYLDGQPLSALTKRLGSRSEPLPLGMHIQILCEVRSALRARAAGLRRLVAARGAPRREPTERVPHLPW